MAALGLAAGAALLSPAEPARAQGLPKLCRDVVHDDRSVRISHGRAGSRLDARLETAGRAHVGALKLSASLFVAPRALRLYNIRLTETARVEMLPGYTAARPRIKERGVAHVFWVIPPKELKMRPESWSAWLTLRRPGGGVAAREPLQPRLGGFTLAAETRSPLLRRLTYSLYGAPARPLLIGGAPPVPDRAIAEVYDGAGALVDAVELTGLLSKDRRFARNLNAYRSLRPLRDVMDRFATGGCRAARAPRARG